MTRAHAFVDTVGIGRHQRQQAEAACRNQESRILAFFQAYPDQSFTREAVEQRFAIKAPSASRALANLTDRGLLERTAERVRSSAGATCGTWRLVQWKPAPTEQGSLFT